MITLRFYQKSDNSDLNYLLNDEQAEFTALPNRWFDDNRNTAYKIVICFNHQPIGFFVLDDGDDKFDYTDDERLYYYGQCPSIQTFKAKAMANWHC